MATDLDQITELDLGNLPDGRGYKIVFANTQTDNEAGRPRWSIEVGKDSRVDSPCLVLKCTGGAPGVLLMLDSLSMVILDKPFTPVWVDETGQNWAVPGERVVVHIKEVTVDGLPIGIKRMFSLDGHKPFVPTAHSGGPLGVSPAVIGDNTHFIAASPLWRGR